MALPSAFITTLAGLALLGTIGGSLTNALSDSTTREAALITFLASASNIQLFGIGGAFWGLLIGLIAYAVLNGHVISILYKTVTVQSRRKSVSSRLISDKAVNNE